MAVYAVYRIETGALVSWTASAAQLPDEATLALHNCAIVERPDGEQVGVWNPATLQWDPPPPEAVWVTEFQFKARLTADERIAIRAAAETDPYVEDFLDLLASADEVNLRDPLVQGAVGYLVQRGLLSEERGSEVLA